MTGIETDTDGGASDSIPRSAAALDAELESLGIAPDVDAVPADVVTQPSSTDATSPAASHRPAVGTADPVRTPKLTRRGRVNKWDRPPPPKDWRWYVGHVGRVLIAVGVLMFGFVAYQLWGTGIENARAQAALEDDFEELLAQFEPPAVEPTTSDASDSVADADADADTEPVADDSGATEPDAEPEPVADAPADEAVTAAPDPEPTVEVVPAEDQNLPAFDDGDALAKIEIPDIGVSEIVVAGIEVSDLKRGPGHFPDTPMPGQLGNAAIAGHRTTYGQPFFRVDELQPGDEIRVTTLNGEFVYLVTGTEIVRPSDYQVVATSDPDAATLTLVSCHPRYTARQRIIVSAELDTGASGPVGEPVLNYGRPDDDPAPDTLPGEGDAADEPGQEPAEPPTDAGDDPGVGTPDDTTGTNGTTGTSETTTGSPGDADDTATGEGTMQPEAATDDELLAGPAEDDIADVFGKGWFSDPSANPQVGLWGLALTAIAVLSYLISRRLRRDWVGLMVGIVPFVVTLYFFFQNVNRLLPPNL